MTTDFRDLPDLAGERLGGAVIYASDDFFAEKENLLREEAPVWKEHAYTDRGKWMDGWESRRKRTPGNDFCIVRLGARGVIRGVVVDTSFFRGNYPESCSIEACSASLNARPDDLLDGSTEWQALLPRSPLQGDSRNEFAIDSDLAFTHLRFNIYPDGGVARLRVHGEIVPDWSRLGGLGQPLDLAALEHGGDVLTCSDMFFGPKQNLIMPGRAHDMSGGWETKRRRGPGHDWVIVRLGVEGTVDRLEIDTNHFKGNYPDRASIEGCRSSVSPPASEAGWRTLLPETKLQAHTRHLFRSELLDRGPYTHLRLNVFPDGGVSRLRVHALATREGRRAAAVRFIDSLPDEELKRHLKSCCASDAWVEAMAAERPFRDWDRLMEVASAMWQKAGRDEWLAAFAAHPRIGERREGSRFSSEEQSAAASADTEVMERLRRRNEEYEARFGHVFLVFATGRTASEILEILESRIGNDPETEMRIAAGEQEKITGLRLEKLVL